MCSSFLLHSRAIIEKERYPCAALSALPRFLAIRQVLQETAPHQYAEFIRKPLLFHYAVLP